MRLPCLLLVALMMPMVSGAKTTTCTEESKLLNTDYSNFGGVFESVIYYDTQLFCPEGNVCRTSWSLLWPTDTTPANNQNIYWMDGGPITGAIAHTDWVEKNIRCDFPLNGNTDQRQRYYGDGCGSPSSMAGYNDTPDGSTCVASGVDSIDAFITKETTIPKDPGTGFGWNVKSCSLSFEQISILKAVQAKVLSGRGDIVNPTCYELNGLQYCKAFNEFVVNWPYHATNSSTSKDALRSFFIVLDNPFYHANPALKKLAKADVHKWQSEWQTYTGEKLLIVQLTLSELRKKGGQPFSCEQSRITNP